MLPEERYGKILELLHQNEIIRVEDLMSAFQISIETARRDLTYLDKQGKLKKIYGGATLVKPSLQESASTDRLTHNLEEKIAIGKKCSEFINDGDSVLLEIGTTTLQVAKALKGKKNLTILTNSIYVVNELLDTDFTIYIIGGKLRHEERAISGAVSMTELDQFYISKAIIGAGAITAENGISDYNIEEALVRRKIIERSKEVYLVADDSKFGFDATVHVCPLSAIHLIVTNRGTYTNNPQKFIDAGTKLIFSD